MIHDTLRKHEVPFYSFDYSIQSFVKIMQNYLIERKALDAVFILQSERETDEALFNFMRNSSLRVILLDQLAPNVIERLRALRPAPNYYAIVANTVNMKVLFKRVRHNLYIIFMRREKNWATEKMMAANLFSFDAGSWWRIIKTSTRPLELNVHRLWVRRLQIRRVSGNEPFIT